MTVLDLQIKLELEGVTEIKPDPDDFRWYLKIRCGSCGEENKHWVYIEEDQIVEIPGSRGGEANLVIKCELCSRSNSISIVEKSVKPYMFEDAGSFKTIAAFECRGVEAVDFSPRVGFKAKGKDSGTPFEEVDLTEKEWFDYDEKAGESVSITAFECRLAKAKDIAKSTKAQRASMGK
eukprot:CFRG0981T1